MATNVKARDVTGGTPMKIRDIHSAGEHATAIFEDQASAQAIQTPSIGESSDTILAANTSRRGAYIYNNHATPLYVAFAATATTSAFTHRIEAFEGWSIPRPTYTGIITGIRAAGSGSGATCAQEFN